MEPNEDTIEQNQDININTIDTDKKKGKQSNIKKVELLFKPNSEGYSDFVNTEEFENYGLRWSMVGTYWYDPVAFMEHINKK